MIRTLLVEDHFLARLALTTLLGDDPGFEVVGAAATGEEALALYRLHLPDLVVMDLRLPGMDGVATTRALCGEFPDARVVVLSNHEGDEEVRRAREAGACAYYKKDVTGEALVEALRRVHAGDPQVFPAASTEKRPALTPRELEVLQLVFRGLANKQIAEQLSLSPGTVRIYVSNILLKLGVDRRTEAIAVALQRGILHTK